MTAISRRQWQYSYKTLSSEMNFDIQQTFKETEGRHASTVSAQIERHSLLERQGTVLGHTMVNFGEKLSKNYSFYRLKCVKNNHSTEPKNAGVLFARIR